MPCYHPLQAYQSSDGSVFFWERSRNDIVRSLLLSCGQCVGCRLERSRQWAVRCVHEAQLHEDNCFITLTYTDDPITLVYRDFQLFMKRMRKQLRRRVRFFMCGEYGELNMRPHFHACLFGFRFSDCLLFSERDGIRLYTSEFLSRLWPLGFATVGDVTFESAAYVARYLMKKVNGDDAEAHYRVVRTDTGEIIDREPEFCHMSLKPGIGAEWLKRFRSDVYPEGMVVSNGHKARPPRYYDRKYKLEEPDKYAMMAFEREMLARQRYLDNTEPRLLVKEQVAEAMVKFLKRTI